MKINLGKTFFTEVFPNFFSNLLITNEKDEKKLELVTRKYNYLKVCF